MAPQTGWILIKITLPFLFAALPSPARPSARRQPTSLVAPTKKRVTETPEKQKEEQKRKE